jgi:hypothetical protein
MTYRAGNYHVCGDPGEEMDRTSRIQGTGKELE